MQLALAGGLVERADRGAKFFLRCGGVGSGDCFGGGFHRGSDLGPRGAVMFSALEVLPVALLC